MIMNIGSKTLLDLFFPSSCLVCDITLADEGFCSTCWKEIEFLDFPACKRCYLQFAFDAGEFCPKCLKKEHFCDSIRSPMRYNEKIKNLILGFKNHNRSHIADFLVTLMLRVIGEFEFDAVIAIPLHPFRRIFRGYNQSELIAKKIAQATNVPNLSRLLRRTRFTQSQGNFGKLDRIKNVKNAFCVLGEAQGLKEADKKSSEVVQQPKGVYKEQREVVKQLKRIDQEKETLTNKKILLIDDVCTTGSTLEECAKELKKAGASAVHAVTAAMT